MGPKIFIIQIKSINIFPLSNESEMFLVDKSYYSVKEYLDEMWTSITADTG